jgi:putative long chain acyl-CoA synthase
MVFLSTGRDAALRATRITNRRWAFSALDAAAAAMLTTRDTVYCCLPLHHPSGTLVATGSALISGARLALAGAFTPETWAEPFWDEVRRYGATVVYYAGEMCRRLIDAPPGFGENNNPVRLFAGSGLRAGLWRRLVDRFGPVAVLEMYASTEAHIVLANARGRKPGSVGRPLPGSPDVAIAAWSLGDDDFVRDGAGRLIHARLDEPGMLIAALGTPSSTAGADLAHIDPRRIAGDAFAPGDRWFVTGDLFRVDAEGDYWFVDHRHHMIATRHGAVASTRIEDAIYDVPGVALCAVVGRPDPDSGSGSDSGGAPDLAGGSAAPLAQFPVAAIQLHPSPSPSPSPSPGLGAALPLDALSRAVAALPEYARPRRIRFVDALAMTDGYRPIKPALAGLDLSNGPEVVAWDPRAQRYQPTVEPAARSA